MDTTTRQSSVGNSIIHTAALIATLGTSMVALTTAALAGGPTAPCTCDGYCNNQGNNCPSGELCCCCNGGGTWNCVCRTLERCSATHGCQE